MLEHRPYFRMELLVGETLAQRRKRTRGALSATGIATIGSGIAAGLVYLHAHGVLHRDVKPSNVFLTMSGEVKLLDFGLVLVPDESRVTRSGVVVGTPRFLAPELLQGEDASAASDYWALGCVLYELASERLPYDQIPATEWLASLGDFPLIAPSAHVPGLSANVEALVLALLEPRPERRLSGAAAVKRLARLALNAPGADEPDAMPRGPTASSGSCSSRAGLAYRLMRRLLRPLRRAARPVLLLGSVAPGLGVWVARSPRETVHGPASWAELPAPTPTAASRQSPDAPISQSWREIEEFLPRLRDGRPDARAVAILTRTERSPDGTAPASSAPARGSPAPLLAPAVPILDLKLRVLDRVMYLPSARGGSWRSPRSGSRPLEVLLFTPRPS